jgi:hypothetical protein
VDDVTWTVNVTGLPASTVAGMSTDVVQPSASSVGAAWMVAGVPPMTVPRIAATPSERRQ